MNQLKIEDLMIQNVTSLQGAGAKLRKLLKKKKIHNDSSCLSYFIPIFILDSFRVLHTTM